MVRCVLLAVGMGPIWTAACSDQSGFLPPRVVERRLGWQEGDAPAGPTPVDRPAAAGGVTAQGLALHPADRWQVAPKGRFRLASYHTAAGVDISVTAFPGDAGGLRGNVDRWRQQLGLAPLQPDQLAALPQQQLLGVAAVLVDAESPDGTKAVFGIVCPPGERSALADKTVFIKATGPIAALQAERSAVLAFVQAMQSSAGGAMGGPQGAGANQVHPAPAGETAAAATPPMRRLAWSVPLGWRPVAPDSMRLAAWHPAGDSQVDAYATVLPGRAGSVQANLARWAKQIDAPVPVAGDQRMLTVLGGQAPLCVLQGPEQATLACGAIGLLDGDSLFLKVTGPVDKVLALQEAFAAFCQSVELR